MKLELKRISIWATIKISFVLNLVFGFVLGCFYALIFAAMLAVPSSAFRNGEADWLRNLGGVVLLLMPFFVAIAVAIFNTIFAFIMVVLYNFLGRTLGGLELEFAHIEEKLVTLTPPVGTPSPVPPIPPAPTAPPQDFQL